MTVKQKKTLWRIVSAAVLTLTAWLLPISGAARAAAFAVPYLIVGWDVLFSAARNILRGRVFDEQFLMTVATLGAFAIAEYPEAAAVMLFYQIGELFQSIAVGKSRKSIAALMDIRPEYAVVLRNGVEQTVSPEQVETGEIIVIKAGEKIPLDGIITEGSTSVDTAALTGESMPCDKTAGDTVVSGTVNLSGVIYVCTQSVYQNSTVAKILELVENSAKNKARAESFITRFARWYTPCVVFSALLLAVLPPLLFSQPWGEWINRALIFLVVSCPCALVVSVPLGFFAGMGGASRQGILIKGSSYLEALSSVDTVVFDKTGTLTRGCFEVDAIHPAAISADELLDIAAAAESFSRHPVAESIVAAHEGHIDKDRIGSLSEIAGMGIKAEVDGRTFYVGNGRLMDEAGARWHECHLVGTVIHISEGCEYMGHIVINDKLKTDAGEAMAALKALGIKKTVILTGDTQKAADAVCGQIGADEIHAGLLPEQKVRAVEQLLESGGRVCYAGDGINDAPVLARADVGVAMGALGSDAAIESADVVLMDDSLLKLPAAIKISRRTMRIVRQNIAFALVVKAAILALGALGIASMWVAVFGDVGVMVLAILNSARAMLKSEKQL